MEKLQVSKKGPYDFVTKTDKNVEKILIEELSKSKKLLIHHRRNWQDNKKGQGKFLGLYSIDVTTNFHGISTLCYFVLLIFLITKLLVD